MIGIKLSGGLGNNMFEYASAKSLAIEKKCRFCYLSQKDFYFYKKQFTKFILFKLFNKNDLYKKQLSSRDLSDYFYLDKNPLINFFNKIFWYLKSKNKKQKFTYLFNELNFSKENNLREFYNCNEWTYLKGCFSSEIYFTDRQKILKWFTPKKFYAQQIINVTKKFNLPPQKRCCVHIRRGDALYMDKGFALGNYGWSLPIEYYHHVIKKLDKNLLYIFSSDDPEWAIDKFNYLPNKIFLKNNSEVVDMFIFTKCKFNILSRGTFSWWGAWLNQIPDKVVYAPKYFLGIKKKTCIPHGMDQGKEVEKWNFVDYEEIQLN